MGCGILESFEYRKSNHALDFSEYTILQKFYKDYLDICSPAVDNCSLVETSFCDTFPLLVSVYVFNVYLSTFAFL